MEPQKYLQRFAANVVKRSGICKATVEAILPHVFDEIRYQLTEGSYPCVPIESFGTFAVIDIPERQRHYTYKGLDEIRTLPPKKKLKFAPAKNLTREINEGKFDPTRQGFRRHPKDKPIRQRRDMRYNKRGEVYLVQMPRKKKESPAPISCEATISENQANNSNS